MNVKFIGLYINLLFMAAKSHSQHSGFLVFRIIPTYLFYISSTKAICLFEIHQFIHKTAQGPQNLPTGKKYCKKLHRAVVNIICFHIFDLLINSYNSFLSPVIISKFYSLLVIIHSENLQQQNLQYFFQIYFETM